MSREKKQELRTQGRTEEEVSDRTLFGCCHKYEDVETVSVGGLHCGMKFLNSCLGQCYHDDDDDARVSSRRRHKRLTRQTSRHVLQSLIKQKKNCTETRRHQAYLLPIYSVSMAHYVCLHRRPIFTEHLSSPFFLPFFFYANFLNCFFSADFGQIILIPRQSVCVTGMSCAYIQL